MFLWRKKYVLKLDTYLYNKLIFFLPQIYTSFAVPGYLNMVGRCLVPSNFGTGFSCAMVAASDDEHPLDPEDNEPEVMPLRPYSAEIFLWRPA